MTAPGGVYWGLVAVMGGFGALPRPWGRQGRRDHQKSKFLFGGLLRLKDLHGAGGVAQEG